MNNKKFRVWDNIQKKFEYFELDNITVPDRLLSQHSCSVQQFLGILDKNMKEIFEGDVVKGIYGLEGIDILGEVRYSCNLCAYVVDWYHEISNIAFDSLEIVGTLRKDYAYDENGELIKNEP
jgi:uncharacterized phage protein (TIGR01671 family)